MHSDWTNSIGIMSMIDILDLSLHIVGLIGVTCSVDYHIIFKEVYVETFKGLSSITTIKLLVSSRYWCIWYNFVDVVIRVELIKTHEGDLFFDYFGFDHLSIRIDIYFIKSKKLKRQKKMISFLEIQERGMKLKIFIIRYLIFCLPYDDCWPWIWKLKVLLLFIINALLFIFQNW